MSLFTRAAATLAATAVVLAPSTVGAAHADNIPLPSADTFYGYGAGGISTPGIPPAGKKAGDVVKSRSVSVTLSDLTKALSAPADTVPATFAATATQLLYRTQNERRQASQTATTVIRPNGASKGVVAYLSYYDGLGDGCDPSYTLRQPSFNTEKVVIGTLVEAGYTVTVPDFEGETLDWAAGHEAGWNALDAIRATERSLGLPASTPAALMGYSGGSIAGDWASELAPTYSPELRLIGTAIGGVPVNLGEVMNYVDSDADSARNDWAGVIPAALVSLGRAYDVNFGQYESTTSTYQPPSDAPATNAPAGSGSEIAAAVSDECIGDFAGTYWGLHSTDLLDPTRSYGSLLDVPGVQGIVDGLVMGKTGKPRMPMLIVQGRSKDKIGDGVMVADDVKALAATYKREGVPVTYTEISGTDAKGNDMGAHGAVGTPFVVSALGFLGARFAAADAAVQTPTAAPTSIHAKLKGHSKGDKDILVVTAKGATGAQVKLFRAGHKKAIGHGRIHKNGKVTIKVKDRNGSAKTRYHATVAATSATKAAKTKVVRLR